MSVLMADGQHSTTVRSVLELEIFRRADAFLATGEAGLDRPVRWVHAGEIPDIARFLSGGEMLLTAGQGVGRNESEQRAYVASVADVGVAGLAIELAGRVFTELPSALIEEAAARGLPLIGLRHEIPFVEASAQVLEQLTANTIREFARSAEMNRFFTSRLLAGADYVTLVRDTARNLGHAVVLESAAHEVQAYYGETQESRQLLTGWGAHSRALEIHDADHRSAQACVRIPLAVQGSTWGWLHMPTGGRRNSIDLVVLEQAASAIAISLLNERVSGARSAHHQGILINRLMLGDLSGQGFLDRALRIGKDLRADRLTIAVVAAQDGPGPELERDVTAALAAANLSAVTADIGDAVLSVIALRGDRSLGLAVRTLSEKNRFLGFSKVVDAALLPGAVEQARAALSARQPCQFFDQLGLLRLLVLLANGPELARYVEDELGTLLAYDSARDSTLLPTLKTYLECDGNKTDAARELFIQRRTLYYRLERIDRVLNLSLDDTDVRLRLRVAVRALELLRSSPASRASADVV